jgi:RecB family exonuclease
VPWSEAGATARRIARAAARDARATRGLLDLLARLPAAFGAGEVVGRVELQAVLADLMAETPLPAARGARGGAVRLVTLPDLAARRFDHVILPGLVEGRAPARSVEDGVYGERERRAIHRALGRRVLPGGSGRVAGPEGEPLPTERTPFEGLLLVHALCAADGSVLLSYPRTADDRPLARSPFVDEVLRAAPWIPVVEAPLAPIPSLEAARAPADLLARLALEALAAPEGRLPPRPPAPAAPALLSALARRSPARVARVVELAAIERRRWEFFHGLGPGHAHVGEVGDLPVTRPIPARALEELATCGFQFLAGRVLGAAEVEESEDTPSALDLGRLAHRCLEAFYRARQAEGALPLAGGDADRAALEAACAEVFAAAAALGLPGHPLLWQLSRERLVDELWQIARGDAEGQVWGGVPEHFELPFRVELGGVPVSGRIDRVDRAGDARVVVDYKLFGKHRFTEKLRGAGDRELQLPIYAAAVQATLGASSVDAAYVSVRDGVASKPLSAVLGADAHAALLGGGLAARIAELGARVRSGSLLVAPADRDRCQYCAYKTACRVVHDDTEEEEAA